MKFKTLAGVALLAATSAGVAGAATFDFQAIADGASFNTTAPATKTGKEADWATVVGGAAVGIVNGGISVVASGSGDNGSGGISSLKAYFDAGSAGLGVCGKVTSKGQCDPSNDDNVGSLGGTANSSGPSFETLILTFSTYVNATAINLAGEGHGKFNGTVKINGKLFGPSPLPDDFADVGSDYSTLTALALASLSPAKIWTFQYVPTSVVSSTDEFYIDSISVAAVPVPASGLMLLGAMGGIAALRRRRAAA